MSSVAARSASYEQIYAAARDWAEGEIEKCGFEQLPAVWEPSYSLAIHLVGAAHAEDCVRLAKDAYARTRAILLTSPANLVAARNGR